MEKWEKNSSCELLSGSFPNISEVQNLRRINLVNLILTYIHRYSSFIVKSTLSFCETSKLDSPASLQVFHIK